MSWWKFRLHRILSHSWFMVPCWKNVQLNLFAKTDPVIEASTGHVFRNFNGAMKGLAEVGISCTFSLNTFVFALTRSTYILRLILIPSRGLPILLFIYLFAWSFSFLSLQISIQKKMFGIRWVIGECFRVNFLWICSSINRIYPWKSYITTLQVFDFHKGNSTYPEPHLTTICPCCTKTRC